MAQSYTILIEQGATYRLRLEWRVQDGSDPPSGALIDTTGYTPHLQIRAEYGGQLLAELSTGSGLSLAGGVLTVRIGADVTAGLPGGGVYDLELHADADPSEVVRLLQGKVRLSREVTTS